MHMILRKREFFKAGLSTIPVLAAFLLAQPVISTQLAFATTTDRTTEIKETADAQWSKIISQTDADTITQGTRLSISKVDDQTSIVLNIDTFDQGAGEADRLIGQLVTDDDIFKVSNNLGSATLSPVQIEICNEDDKNENGTCNVVADTITIQAEWTGIGHVSKDRTVSEPSDNVKVIVRESTRDATASATIGGEDPGDLQSAGLSKIVSVTTNTG